MKTRALFLPFLAGLLAAGAALLAVADGGRGGRLRPLRGRLLRRAVLAPGRARAPRPACTSTTTSSRTSRAPRIEARIAELKQLQARLDGVRPHAALVRRRDRRPGARRRSAAARCRASRSCAPGRTTRWRTSGVPGNAVDGLMKRDFAPAPTVCARSSRGFKAVPAVYAAARANVKNPPKEFTDLAIRMCQGLGRLLRAHGAAVGESRRGRGRRALRRSSRRPTPPWSRRRASSRRGWRPTCSRAPRAATPSARPTSSPS